MALIRNAGNDAIEGAQAIRGNDDTFPARQVVIFPHLAAIIFGQFGNKSFFQDAHDDRSENGQRARVYIKGAFAIACFRFSAQGYCGLTVQLSPRGDPSSNSAWLTDGESRNISGKSVNLFKINCLLFF
ncbi:hypothetical protein D3C80_1794060 [compost metagenome]